TALVKHRIGRMVEIVGRAIAEQKCLHDGRHEEQCAVRWILDEGQHLFADQRQYLRDVTEHLVHRINPVSCAATCGSVRSARWRRARGWRRRAKYSASSLPP